MLKKSYSSTGKKCRVTFKLPSNVNADTVALCGDFNGWDSSINPMKKLKDGSFSATISLDTGASYRFRYWMDEEHWENDWEADSYEPNDHGSDDSIVTV